MALLVILTMRVDFTYEDEEIERMSRLSKLYAIYTVVKTDERFLGQAYLTEEDLQAIEQSFEDQHESEYLITLTDGEAVNVNIIESIEEINVNEN
jgi:hypothetical protein